MIDIQVITAEQTYPLRHAILRSGKPVESCYFEGDALPKSLHLGALISGHIVGVLSAFDRPYPENGEPALQIRGMAVAEDHRRKKIASLLLREAESMLSSSGEHSLLWLNARLNVQQLYLRNDFNPVGDPFLIQGIGMHQRFYKYLAHE
ncbi:MAG: GNAT family N-acetyltransferase [Flavobacteriaceae bacterium]